MLLFCFNYFLHQRKEYCEFKREIKNSCLFSGDKSLAASSFRTMCPKRLASCQSESTIYKYSILDPSAPQIY